MRTAFIALAALALGTATTTVSAKDFVVQHADLDLSNTRDQTTLKNRIKQAARDFCGVNEVRTGTRLRSTEEVQCVAEVTKLANERMAALVDERVNKGG